MPLNMHRISSRSIRLPAILMAPLQGWQQLLMASRSG
nr:MAG TPA: hypothetical protein [Caudoviricetes sp.]